MEQQELQNRLIRATERATASPEKLSSTTCPSRCDTTCCSVSPYDGNPLGPDEQVFLKDVPSREPVPVTAEQAVGLLWRSGKVPEWIDINVEATSQQWTLLNLRCCGHFTTSDNLLYHKREGHPPFHVQGPRMPPGVRWDQKLEKFDLMWHRKMMEQERSSLYPDVIEHGSLGRLLHARLLDLGSSLKVRGFEEDGYSSLWAAAKEGGRWSKCRWL